MAQVEEIEARRNEQISALQRGRDPAAPMSMEAYAQIEQQVHAEVARLLTPDELLDYDMRNGMTSGRLRRALTGFNATEDEYRALFRLYQAQDAQFPSFTSTVTPAAIAARIAAQQQMDEQIRHCWAPTASRNMICPRGRNISSSTN